MCKKIKRRSKCSLPPSNCFRFRVLKILKKEKHKTHIEAILEKKVVLSLLPTGFGKILILYQLFLRILVLANGNFNYLYLNHVVPT